MTTKLGGIGARIHAVEQAASLHHLADEIRNDRDKNEMDGLTWIQVTERIQRLRATADAHEYDIAAYDAEHAPKLTPGERDSFVGCGQPVRWSYEKICQIYPP